MFNQATADNLEDCDIEPSCGGISGTRFFVNLLVGQADEELFEAEILELVRNEIRGNITCNGPDIEVLNLRAVLAEAVRMIDAAIAAGPNI